MRTVKRFNNIQFFVLLVMFVQFSSLHAQTSKIKYDFFNVKAEKFGDQSIVNGMQVTDDNGNDFRIIKTPYTLGFEIKTPQGWKAHGIRFSVSNGLVKTIDTYKYGILNGEHKSFHNNGKILITYFNEDGKIEGKWTHNNSDGSVHEEGNYEKGLKQGKFLIYYEEKGMERGPVSNETYYKDGKPSGTWIVYDRNGKKTFESRQKEK